MQELATVLGNAVTGLFTLLGGLVVWRLKQRDDADQRTAMQALERRKELIELYAHTFSSLEQAIRCAIDQESYELTPERTLLNAKIRLLGSEATNLAYDDVSEKLQKWSALHIAASPRNMKVEDQMVVVLQAPDPAEKYKVPAQDAHRDLHDAFGALRKCMQADLEDA